jgi:hypothetical protein
MSESKPLTCGECPAAAKYDHEERAVYECPVSGDYHEASDECLECMGFLEKMNKVYLLRLARGERP